mgnify:CR=1 FL=1
MVVAKDNAWIEGMSGSKISPYLSEQLVYIGQLDSYERGSEIAAQLMGVQTNDTAIYRLTDEVGEQCKALEEHKEYRHPIELNEEEYLYVQCDGSMLLTRTSGWKEAKLGRVFKSSSLYEQSTDRQWLRHSEYVVHIGSHTVFEDLLSKLIDEPYRQHERRIVFVIDGARWQWSWIEAEYPNAIQILDFYHVMEHISQLIKTCFRQQKKRAEQLEYLGSLLKTQGVQAVEKQLAQLPQTTQLQRDTYHKLSTYIDNNRTRMNYPDYLAQGLLIGSGAIESAHRTVLQRRMKLSGQRWSEQGLTNMAKLRAINMSGYWNEVTDIIRAAA